MHDIAETGREGGLGSIWRERQWQRSTKGGRVCDGAGEFGHLQVSKDLDHYDIRRWLGD